MSVKMVKIRATISIGRFSVRTPYILSFNVNKSRGQISTFSASIKVKAETTLLTGSQIQIKAGTEGNEKLIFSGIVQQATLRPAFNDPQYVLIDISGADVLSLLQGKKYTRRCKASRSAWVSIDNVMRKGLKSGKFKYKTEDILLTSASEIYESTNLTRAMTMSNQTPFTKVKSATDDRTLEDVIIQTNVEVE